MLSRRCRWGWWGRLQAGVIAGGDVREHRRHGAPAPEPPPAVDVESTRRWALALALVPGDLDGVAVGEERCPLGPGGAIPPGVVGMPAMLSFHCASSRQSGGIGYSCSWRASASSSVSVARRHVSSPAAMVSSVGGFGREGGEEAPRGECRMVARGRPFLYRWNANRRACEHGDKRGRVATGGLLPLISTREPRRGR